VALKLERVTERLPRPTQLCVFYKKYGKGGELAEKERRPLLGVTASLQPEEANGGFLKNGAGQ